MGEKKRIKYIDTSKAVEITDIESLEQSKNDIWDMIREAHVLAMKEGIKANSIVINKKFVKVPSVWINICGSPRQLPAMICGLECYFTDNEFPDNYSFAVVEKPQTERERLIEKTKIDTAKEIYKELLKKQTEVYNKYVFKKDNDYDDLETNAIINFSDSLSYEFEKYFKEKYGVDLGE